VLHGVVLGHGGPRNSWITICVVGWVHGSPVHFCLAWHRGSSRTGIWFSHPLARACGRWQDRTALQSSRAPITRPELPWVSRRPDYEGLALEEGTPHPWHVRVSTPMS
jgi:hypothetical protein